MFETQEMRDEEMQKFLEGVIGAVEADSYSQHMLWSEYHYRPREGFDPLTWEQGMSGLMEIIGYLKINGEDRPVCLSLFKARVKGELILFYHATSQVVDYRMVDEWLKKNLPPTAIRENGYPNTTDAMNFYNIFRN